MFFLSVVTEIAGKSGHEFGNEGEKSTGELIKVLNPPLTGQTRQIVTVPGVEFGMEGFLRLSYCGSIEDVREGVRRLKWLLDENGTSELLTGDKVFSR